MHQQFRHSHAVALLLPCAALFSAPAMAEQDDNAILELAVRRAVDQAAAMDLSDQVQSLYDQSMSDPHMVAAAPGDASANFNMAFLHGFDANVNVHALLGSTGVTEGVHRVDIVVNSSMVGRRDVSFRIDPRSGEAEPCFSAEMLTQLGIDLARLPELPDSASDCLRLADVVPQASTDYDTAQLRLNVAVPQIYMSDMRRGYVDPSLWDSGVTAAFVDYSINARQDDMQRGHTQRTLDVNVRSGVNVGAWRLRNDSYLNTGNRRDTEFTSQNTYAQRDVAALRGQLVLGQTYTYSPLLDSVRFVGVGLDSDESMHPDEEQGYAPVVRGNADSNAVVEIRQNGYLLRTVNVAPGPFEIRDLAPSGANGDLEIIVIEADGSRRVSRQAFSAPPLMVRAGNIRYDVAGGRVRLYDGQHDAPTFGHATMLYGVASNVTLGGGLQVAEDFHAVAAGVGLNTRVGSVSLTNVHSSSNIGHTRFSGDRLELRYATFLAASNTHLTVNVQRELDQGYRTLSGHVLQRERARAQAALSDDFFAVGQASSRQRVDMTLNQRLGHGNLFVNASSGRNWDSSSSRSASLGYSTSIGDATLNLSYTHARNLFASDGTGTRRDNAVSVSVSVPFGRAPRAPQAYASAGRQGGNSTYQVGVNGSLPNSEHDASYSAMVGRDTTGETTGSLAMGGTTPAARVSGSYSHSGSGSSLNLSANGSIIAHGGGINLGLPLSETFMLAKVEPSVSGIGVSSYAGVRTGRNGYAVIPSATPYRGNWIGLDARRVGADVEVETAMQQVVPTRGAIAMATFKADTGQRVQFELHEADGEPMEFGAVVSDEQGERLGITDPRGRVLLMLSEQQRSGSLGVQWEGRTCTMRYELPERAPGQNYQRVPLQCE